MTPQETFVARLRRSRQRHAISLDEISGTMRVKRELLEALENNDLSDWPRGLYARAWIRAYASAVGLDPIDTVDDFCRLFPHGDRRAKATIRGIAEIVAAPSEYRDEFSHPEDRRHAVRSRPAPVAAAAPYAAFFHAIRGLWTRLAAFLAPHVRYRRSPRTSM